MAIVRNPSQQPAPDDDRTEPRRVVYSIDARSIWQVIAAVLATMVAVWALNEARSLVSMLVFSLFMSLAMQPAVNYLHAKFHMRRGSAVGLIYVGGFAFFLIVVLVLIPTLSHLATAIRENGEAWLQDASDWISDTFGVQPWTPDTSSSTSEATAEWLQGWTDEVFGTIAGIVSSGISFIFWLATVAMFTFYFTAQASGLRNAVLAFFSPETQERLGWTWDRAIQETGGYFYSRLILMMINGTGFFFTMLLVGMPTGLAVALALIGAFIAAFIPAVGTYIGCAIPVAVTLGVQGVVSAAIVLGYALVYQQIENYILSPKISANTMTLNGGLAFGSALFGGAIAGPLGAFMALPVVALVAAFIKQYGRRNEVVYHSPYDEEEPATEQEDEAEPG